MVKKKQKPHPVDVLMERADHRRSLDAKRHHFPVFDDNVEQLKDADGNLSRPIARTGDTVDALFRNRTIGDEELACARRFERDFHMGGLDRQRITNYDGVGGGGGIGNVTVGLLEARDRVNKVMNTLGGVASPAGSIIWNVVGLGRNLKEYTTEFAFSSNRPVSEPAAKGMLVCALGVLAQHYRSADR